MIDISKQKIDIFCENCRRKIKISLRQIAKNNNSEMFIHRRNGQIRERNSYGKTHFRQKDKSNE